MGARCMLCGFPVEDHPSGTCHFNPDTDWRYASLQNQIDTLGLHLQATKVQVSDLPSTAPPSENAWTSYYLACPYSDANSAKSWARVQIASQVAARLMSRESVVFSPITHGHHVADHLPEDLRCAHDFWMHQCLPMVQWAEVFALIPLLGWRESKGVRTELELAKALGKPRVIIQLPGYPTCELFTQQEAMKLFGPHTQLEIV